MVRRHVAGVARPLGRLAYAEVCVEMVVHSGEACTDCEEDSLLRSRKEVTARVQFWIMFLWPC